MTALILPFPHTALASTAARLGQGREPAPVSVPARNSLDPIWEPNR